MSTQRIRYRIDNSGLTNQFIKAEGEVLDHIRRALGTVLKKEYRVDPSARIVELTIYWKGSSPKFRLTPTQRARLRALTNNNFLSVQYL